MPLLLWGAVGSEAPSEPGGGVDSAYKRRASIGLGLHWLRQLPLADGSVFSGDRRQLATLYSRTAGSAPPSGEFPPGADTAAKRRSVIGIGLHSLRQLPLPDGTIAASDRRMLATLTTGASTAIQSNKILMFFT